MTAPAGEMEGDHAQRLIREDGLESRCAVEIIDIEPINAAIEKYLPVRVSVGDSVFIT